MDTTRSEASTVVSSQSLNLIYEKQLATLGALIPTLRNKKDTELCKRWVQRFSAAQDNERAHRNLFIMLLCHQIEFGRIQYPFTCDTNITKSLVDIKIDLKPTDIFAGGDTGIMTFNQLNKAVHSEPDIDTEDRIQIHRLNAFILDLKTKLKMVTNNNNLLQTKTYSLQMEIDRLSNDKLQNDDVQTNQLPAADVMTFKRDFDEAMKDLRKRNAELCVELEKNKRSQDECKRMKVQLSKNGKLVEAFYHFQTNHLPKIYGEIIEHAKRAGSLPSDVAERLLLPLVAHMTDNNKATIVDCERNLQEIIGQANHHPSTNRQDHATQVIVPTKVLQSDTYRLREIESKYKALRAFVKLLQKHYDNQMEKLQTEIKERENNFELRVLAERAETMAKCQQKHEENLKESYKDLETKFKKIVVEINDKSP